MFRTLCKYHSTFTNFTPYLINPSLTTINVVRCMAGHSKWANIKHNKAAQDAIKSRTASKVSMLIRIAIKGKEIIIPAVQW